MKPGYHEIYTRYRDNITRGVLKPGDKVLVPSADMVGKIHGVWTTANMSIGKFRQSEGGSIWTSDRMRFGEKEK